MKRLLAALLLVPLLDMLFLVFLSTMLSWEVLVALVVLTALLGMLFVRAEGRHTLRRIQQALAEGRPPTDELVDGGLLLVAGAFLLTPGLVTDAIGLLFVVPVTRAPIRWALKKYVITPRLDAKTGGFASGHVYTFGFPDDGANAPGGNANPGENTYDLSEDAYDVEFDDNEDDRRK
ncbi:FxsA family protein [Salarchaeum sp. JOR-1]|uniref:FxsA family protein n=1 Tax=Salarchaeum sp. JOR-1 TaxID=2599399 RepID=UPI0011987318|nr:FxsA family protein [Salarchaeum sp. JOR-1]QDX40578.1 membrane protein FxsA [Salarchaeum sp. JOR-1]